MPSESPDEKLMRKFFQSDERIPVPEQTSDCPDENVLAALVEEQLDEAQRAPLRRHVESCEYCLQQVVFLVKTDDLTSRPGVPKSLLDQALRPRNKVASRLSWWFGIPAGAVAVLLIVLVGLWPPNQNQVPGEPPFQVERGTDATEFRILSPAPGEKMIRLPLDLQWEEVAGSFSYEVRIARLDGSLVWQDRTEATTARVPVVAEMESGQEYYLYVRAHLPEARVVRSGVVRFRVDAALNR